MEESDKMDEDSKLIEELQTRSAHQRNQLLHLEKALKQAVSKQEELRKMNSDEIQRADEIINDLKQKLSRSMATIESKDVELLNLQTALGQFYAESEQKDRLGRDLALARDESDKLTESLRVANQLLEASTKEKEDILLKLSQTENMLSESRNAIFKLEQDNIKVRSALEKSITSLNRMSLDSDNFVDRRIVIKLLVTYFQRNHSKEVLDVMVRILGFSDEDKQRIGAAQQVAGKGVVRGVLGFPGRFVGGILGGSSSGVSSPLPGDNQSFADLWVDFLLKETEEKGRQENAETKMPEQSVGTGATTSSISDVHLPTQHNRSHLTSNRNTPYEHAGSEFTSVPLTSSTPQAPERNLGFSRFLQR
ncbi:Golgin candidate 4 [Acorus calamus]|uniref:Golgin candidate 4 n=1 Tax=Acorus calamus TaxID=4465 RepID=A0AAV9BX57_ACOCL|nr:Golgin candidate 4 [Acorus calamus]